MGSLGIQPVGLKVILRYLTPKFRQSGAVCACQSTAPFTCMGQPRIDALGNPHLSLRSEWSSEQTYPVNRGELLFVGKSLLNLSVRGIWSCVSGKLSFDSHVGKITEF